jgi:hypothetical protein
VRPQVISTATLINDANGVFEDQTTGGAAALVLNGILVSGGVAYAYGVANTTPQGQKLSIEGTGTNAAFSATVIGTDAGGAYQTETFALATNGTATSTLYWRTISSITVDGNIDGNIEGGFLAAQGGAIREFYLDRQQLPGNTSLTVALVSAGTVTAEYSVTVRDPQAVTSYADDAVWQAVSGLSAVTATTSSNLAYDAVATRITFTGAWTYTAIQGNPY